MERLEEIQRIAHQATMHHVKRMPRWVQQHVPDMVQEAILALLKAEPKYDPKIGPFQRFGFQICVNAALRHLNKFRSVVLTPRPDKGGKPLDDEPIDSVAHKMVRALASPSALPDVDLDARRLQARVRTVMRKLDDSRGKVGVRVLLDGHAPSEVRRKGQRMKEVRYAVKNATRRAQRSPELRALWEEVQP